MKNARYKHDCDKCVFLGRDEEFDVYAHLYEGGSVVVVKRFGIEGEYRCETAFYATKHKEED